MALLTKFDPWSSKFCTCPPKLTFNPYTGCDHKCLYCYASSYIPRFFNCRPKKDLISKLRREALRLKGELISISNSSDPYPNVEAEIGLTRQCLLILSRSRCKIQIITKSTLVVRDSDLLKHAQSMVAMTVTTSDDNLSKVLEPGAPPSSERLKAIAKLIDEGIPVSVRVDPIIPYLNEDQQQLIKELASIGVRHITGSTYKVRPDSWQRISLAMPKLAERLRPLYFRMGEKVGKCRYLPMGLRLKLMEDLAALAKMHGLKFAVCREGFTHINNAVCDGSWLIGAGIA
ncbi:MAG: radical SAM protein [Candidatus Bathyarchaeota archaeon]|nr:radical SAM protein [Candidatus Bathyarchaeota archaeon]MCX8177261.1 radical SAM protein [Candidatus Bathyarchaeota archaeon]MDW8193495.1 radical SAM protein [Nitrososphaerota archaeon]